MSRSKDRTTHNLNEDRADWAEEAVHAFQSVCRTDDCDAIKDLICDLIHLCDRRGEDFEACLDTARMHYEAEIEEDGPKAALQKEEA